MTRATKYSDALAKEICDRLSEGEPLRQICRDDHMPEWRTIYDWMYRDEKLSAAIAKARELGTDAILEDVLGIVDKEPERKSSADGSDSIDVGYVKWQQLRADTRLKLLAKFNPKKYGEFTRTELTGANGGPLQGIVSIVQALDGQSSGLPVIAPSEPSSE